MSSSIDAITLITRENYSLTWIFFTSIVLFVAILKISSFTNGKQLPNKAIENDSLNNQKLKSRNQYNDTGLHYVSVLGIDCEMVASGSESILARCSIVRLVHTTPQVEHTGNDQQSFLLQYKVQVVYDVFVIPTKRITDYRTQYSGITAKHLNPDSYDEIHRNKNDSTTISSADASNYDQPMLVTYQECRMKVAELLASSIDGRKILLVGHALQNDFDILKLRHHPLLVRDTALYKPFMRPGRTRFGSQKLSYLTKLHLNIDIQQSLSEPNSNFIPFINRQHTTSTVGHDSVEDAAAALLLYVKVHKEWEKSLGYPLHQYILPNLVTSSSSSTSSKYIKMYLDACNLPMGLRCNSITSSSSCHYQLISKTQMKGISHVYTPMDWIPLFRSIINTSQTSCRKSLLPSISQIHIMIDGAGYSLLQKGESEIFDGLNLVVTQDHVQVDDVVVEKCSKDLSLPVPKQDVEEEQKIISIDQVIDMLSFNTATSNNSKSSTNEVIECYVIVRRKGGGSKTNKKLFDKLNLRRRNEGAYCLLPSFNNLGGESNRLQKYSLNIAKELKNVKNINSLVEFTVRECSAVRSVVVTDDVLLADRVVRLGAVALNYRQFQQMF